jgi:hypothetical protein
VPLVLDGCGAVVHPYHVAAARTAFDGPRAQARVPPHGARVRTRALELERERNGRRRADHRAARASSRSGCSGRSFAFLGGGRGGVRVESAGGWGQAAHLRRRTVEMVWYDTSPKHATRRKRCEDEGVRASSRSDQR